MIYTTQDRPHPDGGFIRAHFGLHTIGGQEPYCSLTGTHVSELDATDDRKVLACGQLHPELLAAFPELRAFAHWHLACGGIPMHYVANAKYWHDLHTGVSEWDAPEGLDVAETFVKHAMPFDDEDRAVLAGLLDLTWDEAADVLLARVTRLTSTYETDVVEALVPVAHALQAEAGAR